MYLFKDFILSINYGPTNERTGAGPICATCVSSALAPTPTPSLHPDFFVVVVLSDLFTYFLASHKGGLHSPLPNIVWPRWGRKLQMCYHGHHHPVVIIMMLVFAVALQTAAVWVPGRFMCLQRI
ncbi:hypothetical protein ACLKA7_015268 [Drosophila subpalustris]